VWDRASPMNLGARGGRSGRAGARRTALHGGCRTRRPGRRMRNRTEYNFHSRAAQILVTQLNDLIESFRADPKLGLFEGLILAFNHLAPDRSLAALVSLQALLQGDVEKKRDARDLVFARQAQQFPPGIKRKSGGVHDAEPIQAEALLGEKMDEGKSLGLKALVPFVVAYVGTRPVRGNDLGRAEVIFCKRGFSAGRRPTQNHDRRADQANTLFRGFAGSLWFGVWLWIHIHY